MVADTFATERRTFTYDALNRLARADWVTSGYAAGVGHFIQYAYDAHDRRTSVTDRHGATHTYTWEAGHRLVSLTAPPATRIFFIKTRLA
ncbi:MAG: RHS repeat domain-containing protein [Hyphomicrobiaceae bacterium]